MHLLPLCSRRANSAVIAELASPFATPGANKSGGLALRTKHGWHRVAASLANYDESGEQSPPAWLWHVQVHLGGVLPTGAAGDLDTAKAAFKTGWETVKANYGREALERAFRAMNIRYGE